MNRICDTADIPPHRLGWAMAFWVVLLAAGCVPETNEASFEVDNVQRHEDCFEQAFPLDLTFQATREHIDSVGLMMQTQARLDQSADVVYVEFLDPEAATSGDGTSFQFGYPTDTSTPVRAEVSLRETCPEINLSLAVTGTVAVDQFNPETGGRMVGQLVEGRIIDARSGAVVAGSITGSWDFKVTNGWPWTYFPTFENDDYKAEEP